MIPERGSEELSISLPGPIFCKGIEFYVEPFRIRGLFLKVLQNCHMLLEKL